MHELRVAEKMRLAKRRKFIFLKWTQIACLTATLTLPLVNQNQGDTDLYYGKHLKYEQILSGQVPPPPSSAHFIATVNQIFHADQREDARERAK